MKSYRKTLEYLLPRLYMSKYSTSTYMNENIRFLIDELHRKIPNWEEYDFNEIEQLIEIVSEYPEMFPDDYENKFKEIKDEFRRQVNNHD